MDKNNNDVIDANVGTTINKSQPSLVSSRKITTIKSSVDSIVYNMKQPKRGKCLVFNHQFFDSHTECKPRYGTDIDAQSIVKCFFNLQFSVTLFHDLSYRQIREILEKVSKEDHSDNDCLAIVMLSHGDEQCLWARDAKYNIDTIFHFLKGDRCPTLAGKPKIFIIQACRGDNIDSGVKLKSHGTDVVDGPQQTYRIPTFADFLVYYSTFQGYYSFRNPNTGSYFIQTLVEVLNNYCLNYNLDLLTLLTIVNQNIAYNFESNMPKDSKYHKKKQIPCIVSMLTRLVYFSTKIK